MNIYLKSQVVRRMFSENGNIYEGSLQCIIIFLFTQTNIYVCVCVCACVCAYLYVERIVYI